MKPTVPEKYCPNCKKVKLAACFHRLNSSVDGLNHYCKDCVQEGARKRASKRKFQIKPANLRFMATL
jgi:hypothetical protein